MICKCVSKIYKPKVNFFIFLEGCSGISYNSRVDNN